MDTEEITESQVIAWLEKQGHELMRRCESPSSVVSVNVFVGGNTHAHFCVHAFEFCASGRTLAEAMNTLRNKLTAQQVEASA
jgi:hypothetical protein